MKKILTILFALMLIAGCSSANHYSSISDGNDVIFTGPNNVSFTKNDLYKSLKLSGTETIATDIIDNIALANESVNLEELEKEADDIIAQYKELGYEDYIIASYGSLDAYKKSYLSVLLEEELNKIYATENYDELLAEKKPVKLQMASFKSEEDAQKCIEDTNNGSTFDMAAANNNSQGTAESKIYTDDDTSYVYEVKEYINSTDTVGLSTIITHAATGTDSEGNTVEDNTYYVLNIESRNSEEFKDDLIEQFAANADQNAVREYFLKKNDIKFYDQDLYQQMTSKFEVLK